MSIDQSVFKSIEALFKNHLEDKNNDRILFSGKFGTGKTTFINHFFESNESYFKVHLYPVNYSISANEDILEYIKHDILIELLKHGVELDKLDLNFSHFSFLYLQENGSTISKMALKRIAAILPGTNSLSAIIDTVSKFFLDDLPSYAEFKKEKNKKYNEEEAVTSFLASIKDNEGAIYEHNIISQIIQKKIEDINKTKTSVLIIDDLERIDPEHIFRLLNVFAASFNWQNNEKNKFGFDKVVVVCDEVNLQNIFFHKFGIECDYSGYIDKFFSTNVFYYTYNEEAEKLVSVQLEKVHYYSTNAQSDILDLQIRAMFPNRLFVDMYLLLTELKILSLRNIVRSNRIRVNVSDKRINLSPTLSRYLSTISVIPTIVLLSKFVGSLGILRQKLEKLPPYKIDFDIQDYTSLLLVFCSYPMHLYQTNRKVSYDLRGRRVTFEIVEDRHQGHSIIKAKCDPDISFTSEDFHRLLISAVVMLENLNVHM
ncbi:MAG: hypothetical protein J0I41_16480 [Filimonas sp.]|nr:hypothetical protein [Filimonas sp.]